MATLILTRNTARQALGRTWRHPPVRYQHAAPAADALDDLVTEPTMSQRSTYRTFDLGGQKLSYRIVDPEGQHSEPTQRHNAPAARNPLAPERAAGDPKLRRNKTKTGPLRIREMELRIYAAGPLQLEPYVEMPGFAKPFIDTDGQLRGHRKSGTFAVPGRWLRDMCTCPDCRHPDTAQKKINVLQDRRTGQVRHIRELPLPDTGEPAFEVSFADGHRSTIPAAAINNRNRGLILHAHRTGQIPVTPWKSDIASDPPTVDYASVHAGPGLGPLLRQIRQYGFCFVHDTPPSPDATRHLLQTIGPIRTTHYGGFYDFTSDLSSHDTAYTSEALPPHTDTTYFTEPAGLQALHLLSHTSGATSAFPDPSDPTDDTPGDWAPHLGGESTLVDGFATANHLFHADPDAYRLLSAYGVHAHASGNPGISLQPLQSAPPFHHDSLTGKLTQWYDAAAQFDALVRSPEWQYRFALRPGRLLLFDNWRVLHGRAAFTGKRRMCGGYIPRDDFISKFKATNWSREEIVASTVTG
ncbi:Trimethyllysine dioxygenase [Teratosphaeria destructans]|uniref:trimethyllysine dioxygenase n=1 Tax=Teratosphaeria destructans TaxID=418781 RepID=A0A9W7SRT4_9PEZI|nr:Trimethyllysine dioxygenase [Teratosphaeria destructans]